MSGNSDVTDVTYALLVVTVEIPAAFVASLDVNKLAFVGMVTVDCDSV